MANNCKNEPPDLLSSLINISNSDITSILQLFDKQSLKFESVNSITALNEILNSCLDAAGSFRVPTYDDQTIYSILQIKSVQKKLSEYEHALLNNLKPVKEKMNCTHCKSGINLDKNKTLLQCLNLHYNGEAENSEKSIIIEDALCATGLMQPTIKNIPENVEINESVKEFPNFNDVNTRVYGDNTQLLPASDATGLMQPTIKNIPENVEINESVKEFPNFNDVNTRVYGDNTQLLPASDVDEVKQLPNKIPMLSDDYSSSSSEKLLKKSYKGVSRLSQLIRISANESDDIEKIYPKCLIEDVQAIQGKEIVSVQVNAENIICLFCECKFSIKYLRDLLIHVQGKKHLKNVRNDKLYDSIETYHETWKKLPSEYYSKQVHFVPINHQFIKCLLCKQTVQYVELLRHLENSCASTSRSTSKLFDEVKQLPNKIPMLSDDYSSSSSEKLLKQPYKGVSRLSKLIKISANESDDIEKIYPKCLIEDVQTLQGKEIVSVQVNAENIICLFCGCKFSIKYLIDLLTHVQGKKHVKNVRDDKLCDSIETYHETWKKFPSEYYNKQVHFVPINHQFIKCLLCKQTVQYVELLRHLENSCASTNSSQSNLCNGKSYHKTVEQTIYDGDLLQYNIVAFGTKYPIIQNHEKYKYCIVCNKIILDNVSHHLQLKQHMILMSSEYTPNLIKRFHDIWMCQPPHIQLQQIYFRRRRKKITCLVCSASISYDSKLLADHVISSKHKFMLKNYGNRNISNSNINELRKIYNVNTKTNSVSSVSPTESSISENTTDCPLPQQYAESIKNFDSMQYTMLIGDERYPIIQKEKKRYCCLICQKVFDSDINCHIITQDHKDRCASENSQKILKLYHDTWLKQPKERRGQQEHFIPSINLLQCLLCDVYIYMEDSFLTEHLDTVTHLEHLKVCGEVDGGVCDVIQQNIIDLADCDALVEDKLIELELNKLYPKDLIKKVQSLDKSEIVTIQVNKQNIRCLLCLVDHFLENEYKTFLQHVCGRNHLKMSKDKTHVNHVSLKQYHSCWAQVPTKYKLLQKHFYPVTNYITRCEVCGINVEYVCLYNHILEYHDSQKNKTVDLEDLLHENLNFKPKLNYHKRVLETIYPDNIPHCNFIMKDNIYPVIRKEINNDFCLLCQKYITEASALSHLRSVDHIKNGIGFINLKQMIRYHKLWIHKTENEQLQQVYFKVHGQHSLICCLCSDNFPYAKFKDHLHSQPHQLLLANYKMNDKSSSEHDVLGDASTKISGNEIPDIPEENAVDTDSDSVVSSRNTSSSLFSEEASEQTGDEFPDIPEENAVDTETDSIVSFRNTTNSLSSEGASEQTDSEKSSQPNCEPSTSKDMSNIISGNVKNKAVTKEVKKNDQQSYKESDSSSDSIIDTVEETSAIDLTTQKMSQLNFKFKFQMNYDDSVRKKFYPGTLMTYVLNIDNTKYPVFRMLNNTTSCLICKTEPIVNSMNQHMLQVKHNMRSANPIKLKRFHNFWMNQEPKIQMEQGYFKQWASRLKCTTCNMPVSYEFVLQHINSDLHKNNGKNNGTVGSRKADNKKKSTEQISGVVTSPTFNKAMQKQTPNTNDDNKLHEVHKSVIDPDSKNILQLIPQRYKHHLSLLKDNSDSVLCTCCDMPIKYTVFEIITHLKTDIHITSCKLPFIKFKFFCEICNKIYSGEISWLRHLQDAAHSAVLKKLGKERQIKMTEYECTTCKVVLFGDMLSVLRHKVWRKSSKKEKVIKLNDRVVKLLASNEEIESVAKLLVEDANREAQNLERERDCCIALVKALKETYILCKAYPFGSRVTGLGDKMSDLDVFIDIGNMYNGENLQLGDEQTAIVKNVVKIFKKRKEFSHVNAVPTARTPIIQIYHAASNMDCDISFRHGLSVENTKFIRLCIDLQPFVQPLILIMKKWSNYCSINSSLSSYALTMLIIFYLQTEGWLLTVKKLREINSEPSKIIDGWTTIKYSVSLQTMKGQIKICDLKIKDILQKIFSFYASYNYDKQVVCPLLGINILKVAFHENGKHLPLEMNTYIRKLENDPDAEQFRYLAPFCIQDPFDLSHNLSKACDKSFIKKFKTYCDLTAKHLSALH